MANRATASPTPCPIDLGMSNPSVDEPDMMALWYLLAAISCSMMSLVIRGEVILKAPEYERHTIFTDQDTDFQAH